MKRSVALLAAPVVVALAALVAFLALDTNPADAPAPESAFRGCDPDEAATRDAVNLIPTPTQYGRSGPDPLYGLRTPNPTFVGRLCDFVLVADPDEMEEWRECAGVRNYDPHNSPTTPVSSELNWNETTEQYVCDNTPTAVWGAPGRRSYFHGDPRVYLGLSRERIVVTEIEGHPLIIGQPPTSPGSHVYYVIQRLATAEKPGILISGDGGPTVVGSIELARLALSDSAEHSAFPTTFP